MKKRLLSLAIAICMVISLLPVMVITAGAETTDPYRFIYGFTPYYYNIADQKLTASSISDFSKTGGSMRLRASNGISGYNGRVGSYTEISCADPYAGSWVAFDVNVPIAGNYDVVLAGTARKVSGANGTKAEAYILPGNTDITDIEAAKAAGTQLYAAYTRGGSGASTGVTLITQQSSWGTEKDYSETNPNFAYSNLYLSAGVHTVLIYCTEGSAEYYKLVPSYLRLTTTGITETTETTFASVYTGVVEVDSSTVPVGGTTTASAYIMNLPTVANPAAQVDNTAKSGYTFTSSHPEIASVNPSTGLVTANAPGKATIYATYTGGPSEGNILPAEIEVYNDYDFMYYFSNGYAMNYNWETNSEKDPTATTKKGPGFFTYAHTAGMWKYFGGNPNGELMGDRFTLSTTEASPWVAFKINLPVSGVFDIITHTYTYGSATADGYLLESTSDHDEYITGNNINGLIADPDTIKIFENLTHNIDEKQCAVKEDVSLEKGEYILVFNATTAGHQGYQGVLFRESRNTTFASSAGIEVAPISSAAVILDSYTVEAGSEVKPAKVNALSGNTNQRFYNTYAGFRTDLYTFSRPESGVTYASSDTNVAEVDEETGAITAKNAGTTVITAKLDDGTEAMGATLTVTAPEEDEKLTEAFELDDKKDNYSYNTPSVEGVDFTGKVFTAQNNGNGTFTLEAPETNGADKPFLYWAKGMDTQKRIISFSNVINNYVPAEDGRNYLIAVYEGDITDTTNEYYNRNGQLIAKQNTEPDLPSIPGLGKAEDWEHCGGNIYVAKYADMERDKVTVTVEGGTGTQEDVAYGTLITCTATGTDTFKCWMKNDEIVSVDETYTFYAWENCTVEAVYEDHYYKGNTMKILIDSFDVDEGVTGVMAEFIGITNAVEKGIMFTDEETNETIKIAMTTKDSQFTVIADEPGTYVGYAILRNGSAYTLITDGLYEHN